MSASGDTPRTPQNWTPAPVPTVTFHFVWIDGKPWNVTEAGRRVVHDFGEALERLGDER